MPVKMNYPFFCLFCILFFVVIWQQDSSAAVCQAKMYNDPAFAESRDDFSPYDKIYIIIECDQLEAGYHIMHANWIHQNRGLVRSNRHEFDMEKEGKRGIYFWFKLTKKGPLASAFTNQDFSEKSLGDWLVEVYLDDDLMVSKNFTIDFEKPREE